MTATPYDLVQDGKILDLDTRQEIVEGVLLDAADPHTGTEFSYPVVGRAWSAQMWQWMAHGMGSGILDAGGRPYWLRNNGTDANTNSTRHMLLTVSKTVGTANAIIRGYFHQMSTNMLIEFPMPSSGTVTYNVCLTYDPRNEKATQGPISVQLYSGTPPTTFNRIHLPLWAVRCSASQLLTDATVTQIRPKVAPSMTVDRKAQLDLVPPESVLWGTRVILTHGEEAGTEYIASGASEETGGPTRWDNLSNPEWKTLTLASGIAGYSSLTTPRYRFVDGMVELRGAVKRTNGEAFTVGGFTTLGWITGLDMPDVNISVPGTTTRTARFGTGPGTTARDNFRAYIGDSGMSWISLDNIRIPLG